MSPNEMMMRGAPAPKIRAQSPADEKFTSPSRGQPQPGFSPAMMAAAVANVIQSSVAMNIRPGSPSQLAQFIHQQLNQSPKQPPPPQQQQLPPKKEMVVQPMLSLSGMFPPPPPPPMQPATPAKTPQPPSIQSASSSSLSSSSSCSYVPQVEAISPTPEDQKENSCVQLMKDKIIGEIEKVEKDLASTQYQVEMLKKKTVIEYLGFHSIYALRRLATTIFRRILPNRKILKSCLYISQINILKLLFPFLFRISSSFFLLHI